MTIAIAASGPQAGQAIFRALQAAEAVGGGAIRGFVAFAAITADRTLLRYETQRGGTRTLFIEGETTGTEPPEVVSQAIAAALISSGPDRPLPLSQFLTGDPQAGLVTAHRVPQGPSVSGVPLNVEVLAGLQANLSAQAATQRILHDNPDADVGFITIDRHGHLYVQNSRRVEARPDVGMAYRQEVNEGASLAVLHNAIRPYGSLAPLVADIGFQHMVKPDPVIGWITVSTGVPLVYGEVDAIEVDEQGEATTIVTSDRTFTVGERSGVGMYLYSLVRHNGKVLGKTLFEPICIVRDGRLVEMSGQTRLRISYTGV